MADYDLHVLIYKIAHSLINVFVLAILFQIGFPLFWIVFYLVVNHTIKPLIILASSFVAGKIGIRNTMLFGLVCAVAHYGLLYVINTPDVGFLFWLSLTAALFNGFYWGPQRAIMMPALPKKKIARSLAGISAFRFSASIVAPLVGAAIIISFGKDAIVAVAGVLMLLSILPLYKMQNNVFERKISLRKLLAMKKHRRHMVGIFAMGMMENAHNTIWPLFVFITLKDFATLGYIGSLLPLVTLVTAFAVAKLFDDHREKWLFFVASLAIALTFFVRALWPTQLAILSITVAYALFREPFSLPTYAATYTEGRKKYQAEYALLMELVKHSAKLIMLVPFLFFLTFEVPFVITGITCLIWGVVWTIWWKETA